MGFVLNQVVDNYECLGIIEKPKTGVTYKVRNLVTGEVEALRTLPGATAKDPESADRLLREIRVHARLCHPNIVAFHDAFEIDGKLVMTTEFVEGPTLAELCREGPLPPCDSVGTIMQVLDGMEEAHALGIVHRAITAEHVTVMADGLVKVGGFGLAKPASDANLTRVGTVVGDPRYISPEQVMGLGALDGRSDLYSVGVLLYQTLTGKLPFEGRNDIEVLAAHVKTEPRSPSAVNPAIPAELDRIVLTALKKKPDERFEDAKAFREALASAGVVAAPAAPQVAGRVQPAAPAALDQHPPQRSLPAPWVFGVIALVALGLAVIWWMATH